MPDRMTPAHARNMRIIGHTDQGGRADGVQIMVHKGHAYIGHIFSKGFTVVDVSDPAKPRPVHFVPAPPIPGRCISSSTKTCCWWCTRKTCSPSPIWPTNVTTTRARAASRPSPRRNGTGRPGLRCTTSANPKRRARSASCRWRAAGCTAAGAPAAAGPMPPPCSTDSAITSWLRSTWQTPPNPSSPGNSGCRE